MLLRSRSGGAWQEGGRGREEGSWAGLVTGVRFVFFLLVEGLAWWRELDVVSGVDYGQVDGWTDIEVRVCRGGREWRQKAFEGRRASEGYRGQERRRGPSEVFLQRLLTPEAETTCSPKANRIRLRSPSALSHNPPFFPFSFCFWF